jgi:hypothetical protein
MGCTLLIHGGDALCQPALAIFPCCFFVHRNGYAIVSMAVNVKANVSMRTCKDSKV